MSRFRTTIDLPDYPFSFHHSYPVMSIGSCFAEHMHQRLEHAKFSALLNPFGIIYNPYSIVKVLEYLLDSQSYRQDQLVFDQERWHSLDHHGRFSKDSTAETLKAINNELEIARDFLQKTKRLILTFGTSKVYLYKKTKVIVANCHKIPTTEFERKDLSIDEMTLALNEILSRLQQVFPTLEVVLTVSPVRHIRDGIIAQQRSKARLLITCANLTKQLNHVHYFPAYEIMMDELRDYRFYASDMIHPSEVAVDYIWDQFRNSFFEEETESLFQSIRKIQKASSHRPFNPSSSDHQAFISKQIKRINEMEKQYPFLHFTNERAQLLKSTNS
jgi:hypothetical protein